MQPPACGAVLVVRLRSNECARRMPGVGGDSDAAACLGCASLTGEDGGGGLADWGGCGASGSSMARALSSLTAAASSVGEASALSSRAMPRSSLCDGWRLLISAIEVSLSRRRRVNESVRRSTCHR